MRYVSVLRVRRRSRSSIANGGRLRWGGCVIPPPDGPCRRPFLGPCDNRAFNVQVMPRSTVRHR
jgi:hypothetical protein